VCTAGACCRTCAYRCDLIRLLSFCFGSLGGRSRRPLLLLRRLCHRIRVRLLRCGVPYAIKRGEPAVNPGVETYRPRRPSVSLLSCQGTAAPSQPRADLVVATAFVLPPYLSAASTGVCVPQCVERDHVPLPHLFTSCVSLVCACILLIPRAAHLWRTPTLVGEPTEASTLPSLPCCHRRLSLRWRGRELAIVLMPQGRILS